MINRVPGDTGHKLAVTGKHLDRLRPVNMVDVNLKQVKLSNKSPKKEI